MKTILCVLSLVGAVFAATALASNGGVVHKTTICHRTMSEKNPWVLITVDNASLPAHYGHGDVDPRNGECPPTADGWPPDLGPGDGGGEGGSGDGGGGGTL